MFTNNSKKQARDKLLILKILCEFKVPLTNNQLTEFVMEYNILDYFTLQQYLHELTNSELIEVSTSNEKTYYLITNKGKDTLQLFSNRLPNNLYSRITNSVQEKRKKLFFRPQVKAHYTKINNNSYTVELEIQEGGISLIDMQLNIVSKKRAKQVCEKWEKNAQYLYGDILNLLVDFEE